MSLVLSDNAEIMQMHSAISTVTALSVACALTCCKMFARCPKLLAQYDGCTACTLQYSLRIFCKSRT